MTLETIMWPNSFVTKVTDWFSIGSQGYIDVNLLLAIADKYGVPISQWAWLCQALLEVTMNKITLWINVCADNWRAEMSTIASNVVGQIIVSPIS